MKRVEGIEDRVDHILQQIVKSSQRRDRLLREVGTVVRDSQSLQGSLDAIVEVRYQQLPQYVERSATLAHTIGASAALAERSSRTVKRLDVLYSRVQTVKRMAESMMAMQKTVAEVPAALAAKNLEKTVELINSYEQARKLLAQRDVQGVAAEGADDNANATHASAPPDADPLIVQARRDASERLMENAREATMVNDKLVIMKQTELLAKLGCVQEGRELYCHWLCDHTIAALKKIVDRELRKMESPTEASMSHLALVSQALDTVAAAYEAEEEFTRDTFGHEGALLLLTLLHQRSTAECVPVLKNFMDSRKSALDSLQRTTQLADEQRRRRHSRHHADDDDDDDDDDDSDGDSASSEDSSERSSPRGASPGPSGRERAGARASTVAAAAAAADARRADQTLEETSHLVSCCHIYLEFAESRRAAHLAALKEEEQKQLQTNSIVGLEAAGGSATARASDAVSAADRLWAGGDSAQDGGNGGSNALLSAVHDILSLYVPLQTVYFDAAFRQALRLQLQDMKEAAAVVRRRAGGPLSSANGNSTNNNNGNSGGGSGALPMGSPSALLAGISTIYSATVGSGNGGDAAAALAAAAATAAEVEAQHFQENGRITLPDDVFFFLRIAVHRALNTQSTQIASAVVMSATDIVQTRLVPELAKRAEPEMVLRRLQRRRTRVASTGEEAGALGVPPSPGTLRWTCAAQQAMEYCTKLAEELRRTTGGGPGASPLNFSARDALRFRELAQDLDQTAKELKASVDRWLTSDSAQCVAYIASAAGHRHTDRLASVSYDITEDVFYHYELNDPWVQSLLTDWGILLDYIASHLVDADLFDLFLVKVAQAVATHVRETLMKRTYSTFGALQADKDVRALREFFLHRAGELSRMREAFAKLSLASTLLLCDTPRDALEEAHNDALTAEEKRSVLLLRVDFKRQDVMALKL